MLFSYGNNAMKEAVAVFWLFSVSPSLYMLDVSTRRDIFFKIGKTLGQCINKSIAKKQKAAVHI